MKKSDTLTLPFLPLRDIVIFPNMIAPLLVGRQYSMRSLERAMDGDQKIFLLTQKEAKLENPETKDLFEIGCTAKIIQLLPLPDGTVKVLVEGLERAKLIKISDGKFSTATIKQLTEVHTNDAESDAYIHTSVKLFEEYFKLNPKVSSESLSAVNHTKDPNLLSDILSSHINIKIAEKQKLLDLLDANKRLEQVCKFLEREIWLFKSEKRIRNRVKTQMERSQREYYLSEQIKAIQKELTGSEEINNEIETFKNKIKSTKLTSEAKEKAESELSKLKSMNPMSSEATVIRNYLDWLLNIPWNAPTKVKKDLINAAKILDEDHYGLDKVKERILEYLAVQLRVGKVKGPILCLVGPPGVGKTSLGESIAKATGRDFIRMALGGVRDESEIRGHRRTYIGSMPGRIIQCMKKAGSSNPLFLLDEVDKIGSDWRGDPYAALLEVLEPEQNAKFNDHYLEVDYNLSDVMFVTTANSLNMPSPLLDRMETIRLSGYTESEKAKIATNHLIPKQMKAHGLLSKEWSISDNGIQDIIRYYTREAGVRNLEREISKLQRKAIREIETYPKTSAINISKSNIKKYLGVQKFSYGVQEEKDMLGASTGLAWTEVGGDILFIESVIVPGKGKITITGKLGDVMQESVQAAISFVRSNAAQFGIEPTIFEKHDIHVHVPEGATPKDGPSAGITICTAVVSRLTGIPVHRDIAMTGEITLRGRVLPIGGLKEKLLAALRGGIKTVIIPHENEKDLSEIPDEITKNLKIIPIKHANEAIKTALIKQPQKIIWHNNEGGKINSNEQIQANIIPN